MLSACASFEPEDTMKNYLLQDNSQYNDYLSLKEQYNENINSDGYYVDEKIEQSETNGISGTVHVSFALNNLLNVTYYSDPDMTSVIEKDKCYLYPGDSIYARIDYTSNVQSNTYEFCNFQMAAFDGEQSNFNYAVFEDNIITIPTDIQYSEVSIIPVGKYKMRELSFNAEYIDDAGNTLSVSPIWTIKAGEQELSTKANTYAIEANKAFRVTVQFDPNEYYLREDDTQPDCITHSDDEGTVTFQQYHSQDAVNDYKVSLGKKYCIKI